MPSSVMPSSTINEAIKQPIEDDVSRLNDFSVQERISAAYIGEAKEHLYRDGFFELDDSSIGDHISELQRRGFPFHSEWALDWTKSHILDDLAVREINKDILGDCSLVHLLPQQPYPGHIFRYVPVRSAPLFSHLVLLCSKGSRLRLRAGSPRHSLEGKLGRRSIYEIQAEVYDKAGCPAVLIEFPAGGKVICDARCGWENTEGNVIVAQFVQRGMERHWHPMEISEKMRSKIRQMEEDTKTRLNFEFVEVVDSSSNT